MCRHGLLMCRYSTFYFLFSLRQVGNMQIVTLMAETMGETVDPTALAELEEDDPSQSFTQQE